MAAANRRATNQASLAIPPGEGERRQGFRAIGVAASRLAAPVVAGRGGGVLVQLKAQWATILDRDWAEVSWPAGFGRDGTLRLRVASAAAALELQHRAPLVIERINTFFGHAVVNRITLVQGPLPLLPAPAAPAARPLDRDEVQAIEARVDAVADPDLRSALARLGRAIAAAAPAPVAPRRDRG